MAAYSTETMLNRLVRFCAWQILPLLAISWVTAACGEGTPDRARSLQVLAAHINGLMDQADLGTMPLPQELASLRRQLANGGRASHASGDVVLERKYHSVAELLARLELRSAHPATAVDAQRNAPAQVDREIITSLHGGTCESALGLSESTPVEAILGGAAGGQGAAWYRLEARLDGYVRVATRSAGPDPSIEIFGGCASPETLASDDDSAGLDAAAAVAVHRGDDLRIHVTNSAQGGSIVVSATTSGGAVSGTITDVDTGLPLSDAQITVINTTAYYSVRTGNTNQNGQFLVPAVDPGTYYVLAIHDQYITELYPNALCRHGAFALNINGCNIPQATAVTVGTNATIGGIDVALRHGQKISGLIRDQANQPVTTAVVTLYDDSGMPVDYDTDADEFGRYSFSTIISGAYKLSAQADGYGSQMYDKVGCGGSLQTQCDLSKATIVNLSAQDVSGADFNLPLMATIAGSVTGPGAFGAQVCIIDGQGFPVAQCAQTDVNGNYKAGPLPLGTYYAYATANGFFSQIFNAVDCAQDCGQSLPAATAITISQSGQVTIANFPLHALPVVHGHVQDAITNLPLASVSIVASLLPPGSYSTATTATTDGDGNFILYNTPSGKYYVIAQSNDHLDQVYSGVLCEQDFNPNGTGTACDVSGATLLTITSGIVPPALNFALQPSSSVSGKTRVRANAGADLPATVEVNLYNSAAVLVGLAYSDALGNYILNDLPAGTYYAEAGPIYTWDDSYLPQVWQQIDCPGQCAPTTGTAIAVGAHSGAAGIDFQLMRRDAVVGRVVDDAGAPLGGVIVDLFDASTGNYYASGVTNTLGDYIAAGSLGNQFFIATELAAA